MRKYGKWLLVLGVLAASPAWVSADGFLNGTRSAQTSRSTQKQLNQQKAEQVADALRKARLNGYDFAVEVRGDAVKIDGKVRDVTHRALAGNVCRKVPGIRRVQNNLQYVPSGGIQQAAATATSGGISNAAWSSASEQAGSIQQVRYSKPGKRTPKASKTAARPVQQYRQPVQPVAQPTQDAPKLTPPELSYQSETPQQQADTPAPTAAPADATPFIDLASSESQVPQPPTQTPAAPAGPSNQEVAYGIANRLEAVGLVGYDVEVRFKDGVATLAGDVATLDQMRAAAEATSQVPGVQQVVNELKVGGPIAQTAFAGQPGGIQPASMMSAGFAPGPNGAPMAMPMPAPMQPGMGPAAMPTSIGAAGNYSNPQMPSHAWPAYAQYPNSAAVQYPTQYSASAWPYIGPFYPYPQVPLGWREVSLEWDDGFWQLDFNKKKNAWYWLFAPRNWN